jgi:hypothetical protein
MVRKRESEKVRYKERKMVRKRERVKKIDTKRERWS